MTSIEVFDTEAAIIKRLAEKHDCCEASIVDVILQLLEENEIDIDKDW